MIPSVPVLLLTGYLGSGKTTLLNRILTNKRGIRFAVVVNDIGEVNIDASLIQQGGVVNEKKGNLVALSNGCICCTLKMDLVEQLHDITSQKCFDYIVIEASGICEPAPIAQTICNIPSLAPQYAIDGIPRLDSIVTVVDALRMRDEFMESMSDVVSSAPKDFISRLDEDDLQSLIIQQIEFCNIILLNKASEVSSDEIAKIRAIIRAIQPKALVLECDYCDVDLDTLLAQRFDFDEVAGSARWIEEIENRHEDHDDDDDHDHEHHHHDDDDEKHEHHHHHDDDDDDDEDHSDCDHEHGICHHHHHHHGEGEALEYGIDTFVYQSRKPFEMGLFDDFVARHFPKSVIRCKGMCYFSDEFDTCYVFEQAGRQVKLSQAGQWYATMPREELEPMLAQDANLRADWDPEVGDRMNKIVFIGHNMDKQAIIRHLDECLA